MRRLALAAIAALMISSPASADIYGGYGNYGNAVLWHYGGWGNRVIGLPAQGYYQMGRRTRRHGRYYRDSRAIAAAKMRARRFR
jgi:hypothetical protein